MLISRVPLPCFVRGLAASDDSVLPCCVSALVEEPALCDTGLVLRRDIDVSRRQQEHLLCHSLDAPVKTEHKTGGKVDKSLRIGVVHLRQIHDHRSALTEVFPDGT